MTNQPTVSSFQKDLRFEGFLLVRAAEQRTSQNGGKYLDMTLCDKTGECNAKVWDGNAQPPAAGTAIKLRATIQEYNGRLQARVEKMRPAEDKDEIDFALLTPSAPLKPGDMLRTIEDTIGSMKNEDLQKVVGEMLRMAGPRLQYFPAAQRLHHAERSGLLYHTVSMLKGADAILSVYPWLDGDLLRAGVIIHDLSKITELRSDEMGNVSDYTVEGQLLGHLVAGVAQVREAARRVNVEGEYVLLLSHMVISHHGEAEYGSPRPPMFPEAEVLHWLDLLDARMDELLSIMERVPQGAFSEKIWSLERRVYHPRYMEGASMTPATEVPAPAVKPAPPAKRPDAQKSYDGLLS